MAFAEKADRLHDFWDRRIRRWLLQDEEALPHRVTVRRMQLPRRSYDRAHLQCREIFLAEGTDLRGKAEPRTIDVFREPLEIGRRGAERFGRIAEADRDIRPLRDASNRLTPSRGLAPSVCRNLTRLRSIGDDDRGADRARDAEHEIERRLITGEERLDGECRHRQPAIDAELADFGEILSIDPREMPNIEDKAIDEKRAGGEIDPLELSELAEKKKVVEHGTRARQLHGVRFAPPPAPHLSPAPCVKKATTA